MWSEITVCRSVRLQSKNWSQASSSGCPSLGMEEGPKDPLLRTEPHSCGAIHLNWSGPVDQCLLWERRNPETCPEPNMLGKRCCLWFVWVHQTNSWNWHSIWFLPAKISVFLQIEWRLWSLVWLWSCSVLNCVSPVSGVTVNSLQFTEGFSSTFSGHLLCFVTPGFDTF